MPGGDQVHNDYHTKIFNEPFSIRVIEVIRHYRPLLSRRAVDDTRKGRIPGGSRFTSIYLSWILNFGGPDEPTVRSRTSTLGQSRSD
jgi:hypothetical protein